jgi:hypothetical protein
MAVGAHRTGVSILERMSMDEAEWRLPRTAKDPGRSQKRPWVSFKAFLIHHLNVEVVETRRVEVPPVLYETASAVRVRCCRKSETR